jgi:negative regulator of sigma-B (phosphoserine phosphatase)
MILDWAIAGRPLPGEIESGDLHVVTPFDGGALVAVIDGLGHGPEAAVAARAAAVVLTAHASEVLLRLVALCHDALRKTRGAVITLASFRTRRAELTWMGIGNVEGLLLRADASKPTDAAPLRGGVVGFRLPAFRETTVSLSWGDTLVLATDGIRGGFARGRRASTPPAQLAETILSEHARTSDDAMVLVARYIGGAA